MNNLPVLFGYNLSGVGNSSIPMAFCHYWNTMGLPTRLYAPAAENGIASPWYRTALGPLARKIFYRFMKNGNPSKRAEKFCYDREKDNSVVYLWAGLSLDIFEKFHDNGCTIILERINCHQATSRALLDSGHKGLELQSVHDISERSITEENKKLKLADHIFCPSPMVYKSMLENGVDERKLLQTSYGWEPERFPNLVHGPRKSRKPTYLFVGHLCIRKGLPLLLDAWNKANIDGRLLLVGKMDETVRHSFGHHFHRDDITHIPYTRNIGKYYNMADAFVFPSLEEGGPMVTYEAMAHGLVPLVSLMGGGAIVQDKKNGLILPDNSDRWATAIRAIYANIPKRIELGQSARNRALDFTWDQVATRRARLLQNHLPHLWNQ